MLKDNNTVTPVRLELAVPQSRVKHSTAELLRSLVVLVWLSGRFLDLRSNGCWFETYQGHRAVYLDKTLLLSSGSA